MKLNLRRWGRGPRRCLLVHGLTADSGSWQRVASELEARGWLVEAIDLRGHGASPRGPYSVAAWADDLVDTVLARPQLAIGHSLGGAVLARAADRLRPGLAVYEDPAWAIPAAAHEAVVGFFESQVAWDAESIAAANPAWAAEDVSAKLDGLGRWDPGTARGFLTGSDFDYSPAAPAVPTLIMLPDQQPLLAPDEVRRRRRAGFDVEYVEGTAHSIHRDGLAAFMACLDGWLLRAQRQA